jgi:hypothetical protein
LEIEIDRQADGRWLADIPLLPGAMAYGETRARAIAKAKVKPRSRFWPCASLLMKSNMANVRRTSRMPSLPLQREHMAGHQR